MSHVDSQWIVSPCRDQLCNQEVEEEGESVYAHVNRFDVCVLVGKKKKKSLRCDSNQN